MKSDSQNLSGLCSSYTQNFHCDISSYGGKVWYSDV